MVSELRSPDAKPSRPAPRRGEPPGRSDPPGEHVDVSEIQQFPWKSFVFCSDLGGNGWTIQEPPPRA